MIVAVAVSATVVIVIAALGFVSVSQAVAESFSFTDPGGSTVDRAYTLTFPHAGSFSFIWNSAPSQRLNFSIVGPGGGRVYGVNASSDGLGDLTVVAGGQYGFEVQSASEVAISVSGIYSFRAPIL